MAQNIQVIENTDVFKPVSERVSWLNVAEIELSHLLSSAFFLDALYILRKLILHRGLPFLLTK